MRTRSLALVATALVLLPPADLPAQRTTPAGDSSGARSSSKGVDTFDKTRRP